ncbi:DUF1501 domain-containing protein (plasmid) [Photobacterium sp. DA100]|uniref:DUF1501 domain-containing protein n=1 Tax=Photobacterium sp. DA100 TaxID=3027472 RepID=UPI00247A1751|nr:DUF1501 domain-containing protein [Photobacterium sp. DA100]WEM45357.1 DUF1501 domain-containing protein [Photobacterium sp. DA100]
MKLTRRRFLQMGAAGTGVAALNLSAFPALASNLASCDGGYKAIVGIDLAGGNDGYNMLVPTESSAYTQYQTLRDYLAIDKSSTIPLNSESNPTELAMHPAMEALEPYWKDGQLAAILNVGTLTEKVTASNYSDLTRPSHLFSHSHQSQMIQSHCTQQLSKEGFGALAAIVLGASEINAPMYDMGGLQIWTNCLQAQSNSVGSSLPKDMFNNDISRDLYQKLQNSQAYSSPFERHYTNLAQNALEDYDLYKGIFETNTGTSFPDTKIGEQLEAVFKMILNREQFQQPAQYFSCKIGGFDTHNNQAETQERLLGEVAQAMAAFQNALNVHGLSHHVTTFTHSDFGRTLIPNGTKGTDHGWASHSLIMGGDVIGKKFYGEYPDLSPQSPYLISRARVIPTLSTDQVHASLLAWLGLSNTAINTLFPALNPNSGSGITPATLPLFRSCLNQ